MSRILAVEPLEKVITVDGRRWEWCRITYYNHEDDGPALVRWGYLHVDCDLLTDEEGYCIGCGAASPVVLNAQWAKVTAGHKGGGADEVEPR